MPTIHVLSEDVINKIAAGEVIERPASVVKELVENSIDAGATKITVDIENVGRDLICITDNGSGMNSEDAKLSIIRHATSKLSTADDLFNIQSLGFRGEALASIAAVSTLSISTKQKKNIEGYMITIRGGTIQKEGSCAHEQGTTIEVKSLFFNTPARLKFLKTDAVELRHIIDVVTQYALIHPEISFTLTHNNSSLIEAPKVEDLRQRIAFLYGVSIAKDLVPIQTKGDGFTLNGFLGTPMQSRNDKAQQALYVNKRWIKNTDLRDAVYEGYHSMLFHGKHPIFVLDIELDAQRIDVNIHPQKSEIKIEQRDEICSAITQAVKHALSTNNLIPDVTPRFENVSGFSKPSKYSFEKATQQVLPIEREERTRSIPQVKESAAVYQQDSDSSSAPSSISNFPFTSSPAEFHSSLPTMRLLGQIHKTFFVAESDGGAYFIDQHAAHERVLYEELMGDLTLGQIAPQVLLQAAVIDLAPRDVPIVTQHLSFLHQLGFTLESFGTNSFSLKTLPSIFGRQQPKELFADMLGILQEEGKNTLEKLRETILTRMACRAAVMAGDPVTIPEMELILHQLSQTQHPYTCPHGRPTVIRVSAEELEKKFKRKG
ncbi:DNA mismatch repair endonuclease MutL [Candidatus Woesearchaeota archaeon]|nr:DNA mismatch repair endonuclease MutL [Candidatus Woesearchaeota archaeon]